MFTVGLSYNALYISQLVPDYLPVQLELKIFSWIATMRMRVNSFKNSLCCFQGFILYLLLAELLGIVLSNRL